MAFVIPERRKSSDYAGDQRFFIRNFAALDFHRRCAARKLFRDVVFDVYTYADHDSLFRPFAQYPAKLSASGVNVVHPFYFGFKIGKLVKRFRHGHGRGRRHKIYFLPRRRNEAEIKSALFAFKRSAPGAFAPRLLARNRQSADGALLQAVVGAVRFFKPKGFSERKIADILFYNVKIHILTAFCENCLFVFDFLFNRSTKK